MIDTLFETHQIALFDFLKPYQSKTYKRYLLLDSVHQPKIYDLLIEKNYKFVSLFANKPSIKEEALRVSPLLVDLSSTEHEAWLSLMNHCSGLPMLSLIVTEESLDTLQTRLAKYSTLYYEDTFYNVRFVDTRRLPTFLEILAPTQQAELVGPTSLWLYVDRSGHWQKLPLKPGSVPVKTPKDYFLMSHKQFELWLNDAELDDHLYEISHQTPELVASYKPSEAYKLAEKGLSIAKKLKLSSFLDRKEACALLLQHPEAYPTILTLLETHDFDEIKQYVIDGATS